MGNYELKQELENYNKITKERLDYMKNKFPERKMLKISDIDQLINRYATGG